MKNDKLMILMHELVEAVFGKEQTADAWTRLEPLARDVARHGSPTAPPPHDYWEGAWRVYEAE